MKRIIILLFSICLLSSFVRVKALTITPKKIEHLGLISIGDFNDGNWRNGILTNLELKNTNKWTFNKKLGRLEDVRYERYSINDFDAFCLDIVVSVNTKEVSYQNPITTNDTISLYNRDLSASQVEHINMLLKLYAACNDYSNQNYFLYQLRIWNVVYEEKLGAVSIRNSSSVINKTYNVNDYMEGFYFNQCQEKVKSLKGSVNLHLKDLALKLGEKRYIYDYNNLLALRDSNGNYLFNSNGLDLKIDSNGNHYIDFTNTKVYQSASYSIVPYNNKIQDIYENIYIFENGSSQDMVKKPRLNYYEIQGDNFNVNTKTINIEVIKTNDLKIDDPLYNQGSVFALKSNNQFLKSAGYLTNSNYQNQQYSLMKGEGYVLDENKNPFLCVSDESGYCLIENVPSLAVNLDYGNGYSLVEVETNRKIYDLNEVIVQDIKKQENIDIDVDGNAVITFENKVKRKDIIINKNAVLKLIDGQEINLNSPLYLKNNEFMLFCDYGPYQDLFQEYYAISDENGIVIFKDIPAIIDGFNYYVKEVKTGNNLMYLNEEIQVVEDEVVEFVNIVISPIIKTKAFSTSNLKIAHLNETIIDEVSIENPFAFDSKLCSGLVGINGEVLTESCKIIPANTSFITSEFDLSEVDLKGNNKIVVYQRLYTLDDKLIVEHFDLENSDQTIEIVDPIVSSVLSDINNNKVFLSADVLHDKINYQNLIKDKTYSIKGKLIDEQGNIIYETDFKQFTPTSTSGEITMEFNIPLNYESNHIIHAVEEIYAGDKLIYLDYDLENQNQMVILAKTVVYTGIGGK